MENEIEYYKMKNSYGPLFADQGYFRIAKDALDASKYYSVKIENSF